MKTKIQRNQWLGNPPIRYKVRDKEFLNLAFDDLIVKYASIRNCIFENCEFKNCHIGFDVRYHGCSWIRCKFHGRYMTFGGNALFEDCRFESVNIQSASTDGCTFRNCTLTGKLRNIIWRGISSPVLGKLTFENCDLSGARFENISIYAGVDFSSTTLPVDGIRIFQNTNGVFSHALHDGASSLEKPDSTPLNVLGNENCYGNQDPIVLDTPSLEQLFKTETSRTVFEAIASRFEITNFIKENL